MNNKLNPKIFDENGVMLPEVRNSILDIVDEFVSEVDESADIPVLDILLVGSNANYNYKDTSDLDIHIVTNFEDISDDTHIAGLWTDDERKLFNKNYDINIKGINAEVYVEDVSGASTTSNGIYSVLNNAWIKKPELKDIPELDTDNSEVFLSFLNLAETYLDSPDETDSAEVEELINDLYLTRKYSIMTDGEFGEGNLAFKEIRARGILDDLKELLKYKKSQELSLEGMRIEEEEGD